MKLPIRLTFLAAVGMALSATARGQTTVTVSPDRDAYVDDAAPADA